MTDIEVEVYDAVVTALEEQYPGVYCTGEFVEAPPEFPHVSLWEAMNTDSRQRFDGKEKFSLVSYDINVYSNKPYGRKDECKAIMKIIDETMTNLGFRRVMCNPVPNVLDVLVYRITARYEAEIDNNKMIYRR